MKAFIVILLLNSGVPVILGKIEENIEDNSVVSEEVADQIFSALEYVRNVNILFNSTDEHRDRIFDLIIKRGDWPVVLRNFSVTSNSRYRTCQKQESYVAKMKNYEIEGVVDKIVHAKCVYLIILDGELINLEMSLSILKNAWMELGSMNVFIIDQFKVVTYDPFIYNTETESYGVVVEVKERQSLNVMFRNLNGYPFRVELFKSVYSIPIYSNESTDPLYFDGADSEAIKLLQERMNFTFVPVKSDKALFGIRLENGSFSGALGRIIRRSSDMASTGFFIKDYQTRRVEFTSALYSDQLCLYVPKAPRIPQSILPLFALEPSMWMCYCFTAFSCGIIWSLIRVVNIWFMRRGVQHIQVPTNRMQFLQIFVDILIVWVRVNLQHFPSINSERLFVVSISLVSVIFGALFESNLANVYIRPLYHKDIYTMQELDESGLLIRLKYEGMLDDLFAVESSELYARLHKKLMLYKISPIPLIELMAREGGFASVTRDSTMSLENIKYFTSNIIHRIPQCPKSYTISYVLPAGSAFGSRINTLLERFLNAGLYDKWISEMYYEAKIARSDEFVPDQRRNVFKVLELMDLQLAFYVVILGSFVGGLVLMGEIFKMRRSKRLKNQ